MLKNSFYAKKPLSIFIASVVLISSFIWMNGCQKNKVLQEEKSEQQRIEEVQKWISEQKTTSFFVPGGRIEDAYRTDLLGIRVNNIKPAFRTGPGCYVDEPSPMFEGINFSEECASNPRTFSAIASFIISSDNAIVNRNPNQPNSTAAVNQTRGRLRITNTAGTVVLFDQQNIISTIGITDLGVDPNIPENRRYRVTYNISNIPEAAVTTENNVNRAYITYYTECEEQSVYAYNLIGAYGYASGLTACNIINKVWINPGLRSVSGVAACMCCVPFLYSNRQEVEIYNINSTPGITPALWKKTITAVQTIFVPNTAGGNIGDGWVASNQTVKIRYRNVQVNTSTGSILCKGSWLVIPETWVW